NVHGVAHHRRRAGLQRKNAHRAKVGVEFERKVFGGWQSAVELARYVRPARLYRAFRRYHDVNSGFASPGGECGNCGEKQGGDEWAVGDSRDEAAFRHQYPGNGFAAQVVRERSPRSPAKRHSNFGKTAPAVSTELPPGQSGAAPRRYGFSRNDSDRYG